MDKVIRKSSKKPKSAINNKDDVVYRAIFNNILHGIISINEKGIIRNINPAAEKMFGYSTSEVAGKNIKLLNPNPIGNNHYKFHD